MRFLNAVGPIFLSGLAAGTIAGLFGVGGGILMVPLLVLVFARDQHVAQGTSLAAMVPLAIAGCARYAALQHVDWTAATGLAVGAVIGVTFLGVPFAHYLEGSVLRKLFGIFMIVAGLRMAGVFGIVGAAFGIGQGPG